MATLRIVAVCGLLFPAGLSAQLLVGRVVEDAGGMPVGAAEVRVLRSREQLVARSVTDSAGWFQVRVGSAGTYLLEVHHSSHPQFRSEALRLEANQSLEIEVRLGGHVIPLEPLVVTARRTERGRLAGYRERLSSNAHGRFVTREQIERRPGAGVTDLVRTIPGVRVIPVKRSGNPQGMSTELIMMRGSGNEAGPQGADRDAGGYCEPALFLDGVRIRQSATFPIEDLLQSAMLEGIEVYSSLSGVPSQFQVPTQCGVVLLWTQAGGGSGRRGWKRLAVGIAGFSAILVLMFSPR